MMIHLMLRGFILATMILGLLCAVTVGLGHQLDNDVIAYIRYDSVAANIYLVDVQTKLNYRLTRSDQNHNSPVWAPDGRKIAFTVGQEPRGNAVFIMNADGTGMQRLTPQLENRFSTYRHLVWSADGESLLFSRDAESYGSIFVMHQVSISDPDDFVVITEDDDAGQYYLSRLFPTDFASPDGEKRTYLDYDEGAWQLLVQDGDGAAYPIDALTGDEVYLETVPAWSPDSDAIAYVRLPEFEPEIYVTSIEGGQPTRLTFGGGINPVWRP